MTIDIVGVSGKKFSSLGKILVCPEKIFDSQNGTLTKNFFGDGGGQKFLSKGPPTQNMPKGHVFLRYATVYDFSLCFLHELLMSF